MSSEQVSAVLRYIRSLAVARDDELVPDRQLLDRFAARGDQSAYTCLLKRHGPMVLSVCRSVLHDPHDAEDAFQATFVVLAQKAGSIHRQEAVGSWLYRVAYHLAVKARTNAARRRIQEGRAVTVPAADPLLDMNLRELREVLHGELQRLPEKYRAPLVLCYLEEKTQEEAARLLGWPKGVVKGRLERGRDKLRARLARRGLELSLGLLVTALAQESALATVPLSLADSALKAARAVTAGKASAGAISGEVAALLKEATKSWFMTHTRIVTLLVLATGFAVAGTGMLVWRGPTVRPAPQSEADPPKSKDRKRKLAPLAAEKPARNDHYGDPLPAGAIARVGTVRLRQGSQIYCIAFSPDGSLIASGSYHGDLCLWDRATGKLVRRLADPSNVDSIPWVTVVAFSPDGKILASNKGKAGLWEVRSGKLLRYLDKSFSGSVNSMAFSPDGKTLVLGTNDKERRIWLYEPAAGKAIRPIAGHTGAVTAAVFSKDGALLASGSSDKTARIWDFATGKEIHRFEIHDCVVDVALAPDDKLLAAQTKKEILLWEVATGRELRRFRAERLCHSLAFSPDGTKLASANVIWDITTGKEVCRLEGVPSSGLDIASDGKTLVRDTGALAGMVSGALAFAPEGKVLATGGYDGIIRLHDTSSGRQITQANNPSWNRGLMTVCGFGPDGPWLAVHDSGGIHLSETGSGKEILRLPMEDDYGVSAAFLLPVALAPDGRIVLAAGAKAIYRWDTATGELARTPNPTKREELGPTAALAFAPDGRTFACAHYEPTIRLWDTTTGKELRQFEADEKDVARLFFLPDGKRLASEGLKGTVQIWDVASGKEFRRWSVPAGWIQAFSPDGKTIVAGGKTGTEGEDPALVLYDLVSGKELRRFGEIVPTYCAFSADGRLLAVDADPYYYPDHARTIQLLEVASGKVRARFAGHFGFPGQMVFSQNCRLLATGSSDTTALIWDVTGRMNEGRLQAEQLSADQLKILWGELTGDDAKLAHRAIWTLAAAPAQAVPLLKNKLSPIPRDIPPRINRLIEELDSDQFAVREKVAAELEELGDIAEPALRKALVGNPSLEVRRRIEPILDKLNVSRSRLQKLRAVEVLEHIASPEAREVLEVLARGAPEARLTREAKTSLQRLAQLSVATP